MGCEAAPEGGPADRVAASCLGSGYRSYRVETGRLTQTGDRLLPLPVT